MTSSAGRLGGTGGVTYMVIEREISRRYCRVFKYARVPTTAFPRYLFRKFDNLRNGNWKKPPERCIHIYI